jgi:cold shock CspA family protein
MAQGTVKQFNSDKGYGFIAPGDGAKTFPFTTSPSS